MEFWKNRWKNNQTGWHREEYNEMLVKHWPSLNIGANCNVLVPLCGKSLDMRWLAEQGHSVVGLELVEKAVHAFFQEQKLDSKQMNRISHVQHSSPPYTIHHGDVFTVKSEMVQADAWYDRAAMIALPVSKRQEYVEQLRKLTSNGACGLLITFAYPQQQMEGPPFALHDADVIRLFANGFKVEHLETVQLEDEKDRGLSDVYSSVFKIQRLE